MKWDFESKERAIPTEARFSPDQSFFETESGSASGAKRHCDFLALGQGCMDFLSRERPLSEDVSRRAFRTSGSVSVQPPGGQEKLAKINFTLELHLILVPAGLGL